MLKQYINLIRVSHWIKNSFVFVPLLFAELLFDIPSFLNVTLAFLGFSLVTSLVYVFNDYMDIEADRQHPKKKNRPLASGAISKTRAVIIMIILGVGALSLNFLFSAEFMLVLLAYVIVNIAYTLYFKTVVIVDLMCIAGGFMLRVLGGALVIDVYVSSWLILTTLFISLFLAVMKRRSELVSSGGAGSTRKVLKDYSIYFIDQISAISAAAVILSYAVYTVSPRTIEHFHTENLVYTTIFVVFGIFRYMFLVVKKSRGENAVEILITDVPTLMNLFFYVASVVYIIYLQA